MYIYVVICFAFHYSSQRVEQNMAIGTTLWGLLVFGQVLTGILVLLTVGAAINIDNRANSYWTNVLDPGGAPPLPVSSGDSFWLPFTLVIMPILVLTATMIRLKKHQDGSTFGIHILESVLWLVSNAVIVGYLYMSVIPDCNKKLSNICTDQRFCCANPSLANDTIIAPLEGCPVFLIPCDPVVEPSDLGWNAPFQWLVVLAIIAMFLAAGHIILSVLIYFYVDEDSKDGAGYAPLSTFSSSVENGLPTTQQQAGKFVPMATPIGKPHTH